MREIDKKLFEQRRIVAIAVVLFLFSILTFGFVRLQVNKSDFYTQKSIDNSVRKINTLPVRGLIKDSKGQILVDNHAAFSIAVIPKVVADSTLIKIDNIFNIGMPAIKETMAKEYGFRPVKILRDVDYEDIITLEENRLQYPGVIVSLEPKRYYHEGVYSPHIFGSLGEVTTEEQKENKVYESGDIVGKTALEKYYDMELRGSKGAEYIRVDASGRELGDFNSDLNIEAIHGNNLDLFMDYSMQQFAESLMVDKRGSLVALDTRNGGVLALVSKPDYDPRYLAGKIDQNLWNELLSDESHPLYSRSIQSVYPPGSTYKIVAAIAALEENIVSPSWTVTCPGYFRLGRKIIHCWKPKGHGTVDMYGAIRGSCNVYFYTLGLKIGLDIWSKYSKIFAFGQKTGIDLPNESKGLVPTRSFFNSRYGKNGWTRGNLANLAIGQGELLITPLQLAQFAMILANKGTYYKPQLIKRSYNPATEEEEIFSSTDQHVEGISDRSFDIVREGMRQVMDGGTGWYGKVPGIEMAGKTGTAQNPHGDSHAWFMAFAPYDTPRVAISVIIENGGGGGAVAAPLARKFLEKYFFGRLIPRPAAKKVAQPIDSMIAPINMEHFEPIEIIETEESIPEDSR
jgi:penicillin-binding protein 2